LRRRVKERRILKNLSLKSLVPLRRNWSQKKKTNPQSKRQEERR
jgi:hypothetical protein